MLLQGLSIGKCPEENWAAFALKCDHVIADYPKVWPQPTESLATLVNWPVGPYEYQNDRVSQVPALPLPSHVNKLAEQIRQFILVWPNFRLELARLSGNPQWCELWALAQNVPGQTAPHLASRHAIWCKLAPALETISVSADGQKRRLKQGRENSGLTR